MAERAFKFPDILWMPKNTQIYGLQNTQLHDLYKLI
jgi:hypothetical protein